MSVTSSRLLLVVLVMVAAVSMAGCTSLPVSSTVELVESSPATSEAPASPGKTADVTELKIEDMVTGTGAEAVAGKTVTVNYTGWLAADGSKFDSSIDAGKPFSFALGAGDVIQGWDQGVAGMKVGGKRKLTIPPAMGYGPQGYPPVIPGNATLVFEVELLGVE